ncbi:MAG: hypothetical protein NTY19_13855 [Planctomycetota bacterium]|nr:hypothetical protein [Planctomycetota bacterium]
MNVDQEIQKLEELLLSGALSEKEFAEAKAGLLLDAMAKGADASHQSQQDRLKWPQIGCGYIISLALLAIALLAFAPTTGRWILLLFSGLVFTISTLETIARLIHVPARVVHAVFWILPLFGALLTNPDQAQLEQTTRQSILRDSVIAGVPENLANAVLARNSYEVKNYYLFSFGTVKSGVGIGGPRIKVEVFGAFGVWWLALLEKPLFEQIRSQFVEENASSTRAERPAFSVSSRQFGPRADSANSAS